MNKRYALISVFNKKKLYSVCKILNQYNIGLIGTQSTANEVLKKGFKCKLISDLTKFPEILNGRVKTLHPKIHASLLYDRKNIKHVSEFKKINFPIIDFVIVNLYPFSKTMKSYKNIKECIEMIDIGGVTILRSAAKNFSSVTTICKISDYDKFIQNLKSNNGKTSLDFRINMSQKVFSLTSKYDSSIFKWLHKNEKSKKENSYKKIKLKYGENQNQKSIYKINSLKNSIFNATKNGKNLGYNNILDVDSGLNCINEFKEPTCVIIKHNNPCGVASGDSIEKAFIKAFFSDPISAFGGIVILNRVIGLKLATELSKKFFEIIVAKKFTKNALSTLSKKNRLILIETLNLKLNKTKDIINVVGGKLIQEKNTFKIQSTNMKCVSKKRHSKNTKRDLVFAYKVCKHVKSNAIVLAYNKQTIGIGAGQMSRLDAVKIAINKKSKNFKKIKCVAASDGFFPFTDNIKLLNKSSCYSIVQPQGSRNDEKIIAYSNKKNISLYFTKYRVFKH